MRNIPFIATGSAIALALSLVGCGSKDKAAGGPPGGGMPPAEVNVLVINKGTATLTQDLPGRVEAYRTAQVRARVDGIVEKRLFEEGSDVKAGATLFQIDARSYQAAYDAAHADADAAQQTVARYKPLLEAKAVSQQEYDQAVAKERSAEAALARATLDLENTRVPAPISGRVGRALVTEGALVGHGDATQLTVIEQVDPVYVNFTESGADALRLRKSIQSGRLKYSSSAKVELVMEDGSVYAHAGKMKFADLAVDPATGSVSLRAEFPNPKYELLPGMFVTVRFPQANAEDAITIPQRAVLPGPQGQMVMVVDEQGKVSPRPIKTGGMTGADFLVTDGLKVGEQVIVDGLQKARPDSTVKPVPINPPAPASGAAPAPVKPEAVKPEVAPSAAKPGASSKITG
jgi:membrane fusion protein (multidrug efflux system)